MLVAKFTPDLNLSPHLISTTTSTSATCTTSLDKPTRPSKMDNTPPETASRTNMTVLPVVDTEVDKL